LSSRKPKVVPDPGRPGTWRVRWPGGRLSDMTNFTRAKDAVACFVETDECPAGGTAHQKAACASKLILGGKAQQRNERQCG